MEDGENGPDAADVREMGEQPLARLMRERGLSNHDLVAASARPISHKLVMRAARGRRLTVRSKALVVEAFNRATGGSFRAADLFDYPSGPPDRERRGAADADVEPGDGPC